MTGGVHSAFIDGHHVYLTDDATGSLRVIDFEDPRNPKEVARWQIENPLAKSITLPEGESFIGGPLPARRLREGRSPLPGLLARRSRHPRHRQRRSRAAARRARSSSASSDSTTSISTGPAGWPARTRSSATRTTSSSATRSFRRSSTSSRAIASPCRASSTSSTSRDIEHPRRVAQYAVPEAGAHNMWVDDDVMVHGLLQRRRPRRRRVGRTARRSVPAGPRDRAALDRRSEGLAPEPARSRGAPSRTTA